MITLTHTDRTLNTTRTHGHKDGIPSPVVRAKGLYIHPRLAIQPVVNAIHYPHEQKYIIHPSNQPTKGWGEGKGK